MNDNVYLASFGQKQLVLIINFRFGLIQLIGSTCPKLVQRVPTDALNLI